MYPRTFWTTLVYIDIRSNFKQALKIYFSNSLKKIKFFNFNCFGEMREQYHVLKLMKKEII